MTTDTEAMRDAFVKYKGVPLICYANQDDWMTDKEWQEQWFEWKVCWEIAQKAALASQTVPEWQPIDTAPRDGTQVIVWTIHDDIELSAWYEIPQYSFEPADGGLFKRVKTDAIEGWNSNTPKYWMPLPATPAAESEGA